MAEGEILAYILKYGGYFFIAIAVLGLMMWGGIFIRNKHIYVFKHKTTRQRIDGKEKEIKGKAGFIVKRDGLKYFRLKLGKFPWQKVDLIEHPDLSKVDGDNTVHYMQLGPDIFFQTSRNLIPRIEYDDYIRDENGQLIQMRDKDNNLVWMRDKKGELIYEINEENGEDGKPVEIKYPIPVYIPVPKEYKVVEEIAPLTNIKKAYTTKSLAFMSKAINPDATWKTAAVWVGGVIMIIIVSSVALYFMAGGGK